MHDRLTASAKVVAIGVICALEGDPSLAGDRRIAEISTTPYSPAFPYQVRAGCVTAAGSRRMRLAPSGRVPALSWS